MYELRLEVNIDVIKRDIEPETVRRIVANLLRRELPQYVELQTVLVAK